MQTFLPYPDVVQSLAVLDNRRLGKQRVETFQVLRALDAVKHDRPYGWKRHPVVRMWTGHEPLLATYLNASLDEWERRGFRNNMERWSVSPADLVLPAWWADERVHASHRSNLLRKDPGHYGQFGWAETPDLPYFWPDVAPMR